MLSERKMGNEKCDHRCKRNTLGITEQEKINFVDGVLILKASNKPIEDRKLGVQPKVKAANKTKGKIQEESSDHEIIQRILDSPANVPLESYSS
jgi:hypothetical protein